MGEEYNLYIIYSKQKLCDILASLYTYSDSDNELGPIRKDYSRDSVGNYIETNRNITLIHNFLYHRIVSEGLDKPSQYDFIIAPYQIRKDNYPPENSLPHLFFPVKNNSFDILTKKMIYLCEMQILTEKDYQIKKKGIILFQEKISLETRIKIKIIIDDVEDGYRVSWCKKKIFTSLQ